MPRIMIKGGIWTNVEVSDVETICLVDVVLLGIHCF